VDQPAGRVLARAFPPDWHHEDGSLVDGGWLYAAGDVNHRALLTRQGKYQARAAGDVIVARATGTAVDATPWGRQALIVLLVVEGRRDRTAAAAAGAGAADADRHGR